MKKRLLRGLIPFGIYPHISFTYSPFKVLEFGRLMDRCDLQGHETALDRGCGDGLHTVLIGGRVGQVTRIDIASELISDARDLAAAMGRRVQADFRDCPWRSAASPASSSTSSSASASSSTSLTTRKCCANRSAPSSRAGA